MYNNLNFIIILLIIIYLYCLYNNLEFFISNHNNSTSKCQMFKFLFNKCKNNKELPVCHEIDYQLSLCNNNIDQININKLKDIITQVSKENNEDLNTSLYCLKKAILFTNYENNSNTTILKKKIINLLNNLKIKNKKIKLSDNIKEIIASSLSIIKHLNKKTNENIEIEINNITNNSTAKLKTKLIIN